METKITNVGGRRDYISNPARQENLCATYSTINDDEFWNKLAVQNRQQFLKTGQGSRDCSCGEAKELIIMLPNEEKLKNLDYGALAKYLAEDFKKKYRVECDIAIHLNKTKSNLHAHLIFAERRKLHEPIIKYADRKAFFNEQGIRTRTKKEILDEGGHVRNDCRVIEKGDVISAEYFDKKIEYFKTKGFLLEAKEYYARLLSDISIEKYKVFDHSEPFLATKHIGKAGAEYVVGLQERNKQIFEYNNLVNQALESDRINFDDAVELKKKTQGKIREANKLTSIKNEAVMILKKECEKLRLLIGTLMPHNKKRIVATEKEVSATKVAERILDLKNLYIQLEKQIKEKPLDTKHLISIQERAELKYKTEILMLELRPDMELINQLISIRRGSVSIKEKMIIAKAESKLRDISKSDFQQIRAANPEETELVELIKRKEDIVKKSSHSLNR